MDAIAPFLMNIGGSEWFIIIILGLVLLFGSGKFPQVSRTLGKAMGEYEKARELFRREMDEASRAVNNANPLHNMPRITGPVASEREKLETIAKSLGIDHVGKTDEELRDMISEKMQP